MIFRKPNAFIIKHIKLIHTIILLCMIYLLTKMSNISSFYKHVVDVKSIVGTSNIAKLFDVYMFIAIFIAILLITSILLILIIKKKKFLFYLISDILIIFILIYISLAYNNIKLMQKEVIDAPIYMAFNDILKIIFYTLSVFVFIYLIKATGFNIKTFNFEREIVGFDLTEDDSEEIEFNFEIDSNEIRTARHRKIRNLKYFYLENKFKLNLIVFLLLSITIISIIYFAKTNKELIYKQGDELSTTNYNIVLNDAYVTNLNYKGEKKYKNNYFVILMFNIKENFNKESTFNTNGVYLEIDNTKYYATDKYNSEFIDFGNAYKEQKLTQEYLPYYMIYQIPYEFSTNDIFAGVASNFDYTSNKYNFYKVKIDYDKISKEPIIKEYKVNDEMNIDVYGVHTKINISAISLENKYKLKYNYNIFNKTYESYEYITPKAANNEEKTILRLNVNQEFSENQKRFDFYEILSYFATIEYQINDQIKESKIYSRLTPSKVKEDSIYYIEISKSVLDGNNKNLKIKIRDRIYKYSLEA